MSEKMDKDEKLDKAFRRRCVHYVLKPMTELEIKALVQRAAENSSLDYDTTTFIAHIIKAKVGSPGEIIAAWEKYSSGTPLAECLIDSAHQAEYRDIALAVTKGDWNTCRSLLAQVQTADSRALRGIVAGFLRSALVKQDVGPKAAALATCVVGMGSAGGFEDGLSWSATCGLFYKTCVAIAGAK
jgi:ribosomal protein S17E